jgi:crotonobetainyl-CoA:carnitine CoA-transferase CaiB-like acyl-CoA transferase
VTLPLEGIRVVSLALQYPGPFATLLLGDHGADVLVVERPDDGDPTRAFPGFHGALGRGKRSVALDLKQEGGRRALRALLTDADALLEGFRPGTMARLGFAAEDVTREHPALVYVSVSGFGQTGPNAARPGHDLTYQAEAGMHYEHLPPAPPPPPPSLAQGDLAAGMFVAQAVLAGIVQRGRTGRGCVVDVAMTDCLTSLLAAHVGPVVNGTGPPGFPYEPGYGVFVTADGAHLALGVAHEDHFWRALCDLTGMAEDRELTSPERFAAHERLHKALAAAIERRPLAEWEGAFAAADVPFGTVRSLEELPRTPQAVARGMFGSVESPAGPLLAVRQPLIVDGATPGPRRGTPLIGEHTSEALREAGVDQAQLAELIGCGAAVQNPAAGGTGGTEDQS